MSEFLFGVYPYICLVIFTIGLVFRYMATPGEWNARSSNLFARESLAIGSFIFHYAIILAFFGHIFGLLTPAALMNAIGFTDKVHMAVAGFFGKILAPAVLVGLGILLWRRLANHNVRATTVAMDIVVIVFILWQAFSGGWQDYVSRSNVFATVAPWIRGILTCRPDPHLMDTVPVIIKAHIICGFAIFAMIPFSRLVHFFSIPLTWFCHPLIAYRRRYENL